MTLPSATIVPEVPKDVPPSEREAINVYQLMAGHPQAYRFYAQALPIGERPVNAYGDSADEVEGRVKRLLDAGWE